ncbi:MAG: tetratricopeptide repeat protein [Vicinamibacterales bacterium]
MSRLGCVLAGLLLASPLHAQTPTAPNAPTPSADAYYEFLMGHRLDNAGDAAGALAALERAKKADPNSAEILAEVAGFYAKRNKAEDAVVAANQALALDPNNVEAHHMLGLVYSAWSEGVVTPPAGQTPEKLRQQAIDHLSAIQSSPIMASDPNLQMSLGRLQLRAGRASLAVPILEKVAAQVPWSAEPLALLAEARSLLGRFDEAAEALQAAAEINPRYWAPLGDLYDRLDRPTDAAEAYGEAVERGRNPSRDLRLRWATALLSVPNGGGAAKAREVLDALLKASPNDVRALYLLASTQRAGGQAKEAEATARKILAIDSTNANGLYALALILFDRFDYRQAATALTPFEKDAASRAKGREGETAMVLVQLGIARQQLGEYDGAIAAFTTAQTVSPRNPDMDAYLVQGQLAARRFDRAEAAAGDALSRSPGHSRLVRLRAQALAKLGRGTEATKLLEDGIASRPDSREYVVGLADLYSNQKRTDDAVRVLEQARAKLGDDETLILQLATVYEAGDRITDAEKELRRLLQRDPRNANALNSLGYMFATRGVRGSEAVELAQRAVELEPDNPAYLDTLGWALFKIGRVDEADSPLARAAGALIGSSVIQEHHGDVLARRGKPEEAVKAWERALVGDGESIDRAAIEKKIQDARARRR